MCSDLLSRTYYHHSINEYDFLIADPLIVALGSVLGGAAVAQMEMLLVLRGTE